MDKQPSGQMILWRDAAGNILPMTAAAMVVMAGLVGGGVDMSRAYKVQNRLQNACDSGVLAGRRAVANNGFDTAAQNQAKKFFEINFDQSQQGTNTTAKAFTGDTAGNSISGTASTKMPMLIMQMFGKGDMTISVKCQSTMGVGNSDITLVLDVTGSMSSSLSGGGTRISALRTAMKNFYTSVKTASAGSNARIRYSLVPFSSTVNVGRLIRAKNPDYLADTMPIQSRVVNWANRTENGTATNSTKTDYASTVYASMAACNLAKPANTAWANNGDSTTSTSTFKYSYSENGVEIRVDQPQRMTSYVCEGSGSSYKIKTFTSDRTVSSYQTFNGWIYKQQNYDVSQFKNFSQVSTFTGEGGSLVASTWAGCIEERLTVAASSISYNTLTGMSPSGARDLDIDSAPTTDPDSKWKPMWPEVAYNRDGVDPASSGSKATSYCVPEATALATMTQSDFNDYADSLTAQGSTYLDIGMLWGARLSSPDGVWSSLVNEAPVNAGDVNRHIIFMTDGDLATNSDLYQAYGIEWLDRRVTGNGSQSREDTRHSLRFRAICDAVKAKGIRVWVIGFTTGLTADLAYCTSPNSSYTANSAADLNTAFQTIAKQVGELRVLS